MSEGRCEESEYSGGSPWRRCESCVSAGPSSY